MARQRAAGMRWAAAIVVVLLVATAVFVLDRRLRAHPSGPVAVVGDSISFVSTGAIHDALEPRYTPEVKSRLGVTVGSMAPTAERMATTHPRQAVIELGTNDVLYGVRLDDAEHRYNAMVAAFDREGVDCIHVVNVNTRMRSKLGFSQGRAEEFNSYLQHLADRRDDVVLVDWNAAVEASAERRQTEDAPRLLSDTVHPTAEGSRVLAQLIRDSLDRGCDSGLL